MTQTPATTTSYAPGEPNWVDVMSPDVAASTAFYHGVFGWNALELGEDAGGYVMFELGGSIAAAVGPLQEGAHPAWMVYFNSVDVDATAASVTAAGGQVVAPPFDVLDQGRMAVFADPTGAFFSVWQPMKMPGLGIKGEPNTYGWCELNTRGVDRAAEFYKSVFGWDAHLASGSQEGVPYTEWQLGGRSFGGAIDMANVGLPAEMPPHWLVYFNTADIQVAVARVAELGGKVMMEPTDYPGGRFAVVADPVGCAFGLMISDS